MLIKKIKLLPFIIELVILFFAAILFVPQTQAACTYQALCDAPAGECATTCNGGQPCQINNGGLVEQCNKVCLCSTNAASCSVEGSLCGGSGSDPYNVDSNFGTCVCQEIEPCEIVELCSETTWEYCCTPGSPAPSGSPVAEYCGDGSCNNGETCDTCESDCGSCAPTAFCGDGSCNGGETCDSCNADCGSCPGGGAVCGNSVCEVGETCSGCPGDCGSCLTCGDGTCNNGETCSTCAADCGTCAATCGDGACTGFETCESCSADCGACIFAGNQPWWQVSNGHAYAGTSLGVVMQSNIFENASCVAPDCIAQLIYGDSTDTTESEGIALTGGGTINANGFINTEGSKVIGSAPSRFRENYDFFYRNSGLGLNPTSDFSGQEDDIQEPITTKEAYYQSGDVTLQSPWTVSAGESYVIFINGNLTISDPTNANQLIDVEEGGFLAFIVSGTITITEDVGNEILTDATANLEGMFLSDGILTIESRGEAGGGDDRFIGEGSFISWTRVAMDRNYSDGAGRESENQSSPTESFIFRPDLVANTPEILTRPHSIWQETN